MNKQQKLAEIEARKLQSIVVEGLRNRRTITVNQPDADDDFEIIISEKLQGLSIYVRPDQAKQLAEFINKHYRIITNDLP